jgi:hypothetical protein
MTTKCTTDVLKAGDWLSRTTYIKVVEVTEDMVEVENDHGLKYAIGRDIVEAECNSGHFEKTYDVNRTELARIMREETRESVFVCSFLKAVTEDHIAEILASIAVAPAARTVKERKTAAKELMKGERRELTGYMLGVDETTGRFRVVDLNVDSCSSSRSSCKERQVDPRTLEWLVLRNIKYRVAR